MSTFEGNGCRVEATLENTRRIINLAKSSLGLTQQVIGQQAGIYSTQLSKFMNHDNFKDQKGVIDAIVKWVHTQRHFVLVSLLNQEIGGTTTTFKQRLIVSMNRTKFFAKELYKLFEMSGNKIEEKERDGLQAFYVCYKRSQRFRREDSPERERKIVKSILIIKFDKENKQFLFEDWQSDRNDVEPGKGREITHGVVFWRTDDVFLFGRETEKNQPRLFWLRRGDIASDDTSDEWEDHIQSMIGYCFEGYAKYRNPDGHLPGSFFSPIGLERIPLAIVNERAVEFRNAQDPNSAELELTEWSDAWLDYARDALFEAAEIIGDMELPHQHIISRHLSSATWIDSNESRGAD